MWLVLHTITGQLSLTLQLSVPQHLGWSTYLVFHMTIQGMPPPYDYDIEPLASLEAIGKWEGGFASEGSDQ